MATGSNAKGSKGLDPLDHIMSISILCIGVFISAVSFFLTSELEQKNQREVFQHNAELKINEIVRTLQNNIQQPLSIASFFGSSNEVDKKDFYEFTRHLLSNYVGLTTLQWAPVVLRDNRLEFETNSREIFPDFQITNISANGELQISENKKEYVPVLFCEPLQGNESAHGFDISSNPTRRKMLEFSRDSGRSAVSEITHLAHDAKRHSGLLVSHPVYLNGITPATLAERRNNILGYAIAELLVDEIVSSALQHFPTSNAEIAVFDYTDRTQVDLIYEENQMTAPSTDASANPNTYLQSPINWSRSFQMHNRTWKIHARPSPGAVQTGPSWRAFATMVFLLLLTILGTFYTMLLNRKDKQLTAMIGTKNAEIKQRRLLQKQLSEANDRLEILSREDALLGIFNRRKFNEYFNTEWQRGMRHGKSLSLIIIDVDDFKAFNDNYGHIIGDRALREVALVTKSCANRAADLVARYGGEEIAIILPETQVEIARRIANSIRNGVLALGIPNEGADKTSLLSISAGVGSIIPSFDVRPTAFIAHVDAAMYQAKRNGKNAVRTVNTGHPDSFMPIPLRRKAKIRDYPGGKPPVN